MLIFLNYAKNYASTIEKRLVCTVKYRTEVLRTKNKRSPTFHGTEPTSEVNKLIVIWLAVIFRVSVTFCFIIDVDGGFYN